MLNALSLSAGYGGGSVLHRLDLTVAQGGVHAVLGHNGAGKTTLVHALAGLLRPASGRVELDGADVTGLPAHRRARAGLGLVPQGRRVFAGLTVAEHLTLARRSRTTGWTPSRILALFPALEAQLHQRGDRLSGGQQQMLALARAMLTGPRVLLLDEPTEGLAPLIAEEVLGLVRQLADEGLAVLITAPRPGPVLPIADRLTVLTAGRVSAGFDGATARRDPPAVLAALTPG